MMYVVWYVGYSTYSAHMHTLHIYILINIHLYTSLYITVSNDSDLFSVLMYVHMYICYTCTYIIYTCMDIMYCTYIMHASMYMYWSA
jgi:hypothetical protein